MAQTRFFCDPFKFVKGFIEERKSEMLQASEKELEEYINDNLRDKVIPALGAVPLPRMVRGQAGGSLS